MDRYSTEAARAQGPDIDEEADGAHAATRAFAAAIVRQHGIEEIERLDPQVAAEIRDVLGMDPPGFDPATEGP